MTPADPRLVPYHWWGDAWSRPNIRSLDDLIATQMIEVHQADLLAARIALGESVVVVSEQAGVGKSTLAHALTMYIPGNRISAYIRGSHEQFTWASAIDPSRLTLLVNEIGESLPVYLHGEALDSSVGLVAAGAQLVATAHLAGLELLRTKLESTNSSRATPLTSVWITADDPGPIRVSRLERQTFELSTS